MRSALYCLFLLLTLAVLASDESNDDTVWTADQGNWGDAANWSNGVPDASLETIIANGGLVKIEGTSAHSGPLEIISGWVDVSEGSLAVAADKYPVVIGNSHRSAGLNIFWGGSVTVSAVNVGNFEDSLGRITLYAGILSANSTEAASVLGFNKGHGFIEQRGGTAAFNGLFLGIMSKESRGGYFISGGSLTNKNEEIIVGYHGTGSFYQSGDSYVHTTTGLELGGQTGASGTYTIDSGTLLDTSTASGIQIGWNGRGEFIQNNGSVTTHGGMILGYGQGSGGLFLITKNFLTGGDSTVQFISDEADVIRIVVGGSTKLGGLQLSVDLSGLRNDPTHSELVLLALGSAYSGEKPVNNYDGARLSEDALVHGTGLATPPRITYSGGDGNDIALLGVVPNPDPDPSLPYLVAGAIDFGHGWYGSWIGTIKINSWPWVFGSLGWFYAGTAGNINTGSWFHFINPMLNCWLYASQNHPQWIYLLDSEQPEGWWFVDRENGADPTHLHGPGGATFLIPSQFKI